MTDSRTVLCDLTRKLRTVHNILRAVLIKLTAQNWNMRTIYLVKSQIALLG